MPDLELARRKVNTRDAINVEVFSLDDINRHFNDSVSLILKQIQLADNLFASGLEEEAKDILRSQIVFIDSAFDFYLHEILKLGIINMFHGDWTPKTDKYNNLLFDMKTLEAAITDDVSDEWLKNWINNKYSGKPLMSYEDFVDVCNLLALNVQDIADKLFYDKNSRTPTRDKLKYIISRLCARRNQIAHQSDRKRENAEREDITRDYVNETLEDIRKIVDAVHFYASQK